MADLAVAFASQLRLRGLVVPPDTVVGYARALDALGLDDRDAVYWAGRSTLIRRPEDVEAYDAAFRDFWEGQAAHIHRSHSNFERRIVAVDDPDQGEADGEGDPSDEVLRWSAVEVLRHKDLAELTAEERAEADRMIDALRLTGPHRRSRRRVRSHRGDLDLRRAQHDTDTDAEAGGRGRAGRGRPASSPGRPTGRAGPSRGAEAPRARPPQAQAQAQAPRPRAALSPEARRSLSRWRARRPYGPGGRGPARA